MSEWLIVVTRKETSLWLFYQFAKGKARGNLWPAVDIAETENEFVVKAEEEKKEKGYYHVERSYGSFRRELVLGSDIDLDKIEAVCKDGILTLTLPKSEKAKAVKVKVKEQ